MYSKILNTILKMNQPRNMHFQVVGTFLISGRPHHIAGLLIYAIGSAGATVYCIHIPARCVDVGLRLLLGHGLCYRRFDRLQVIDYGNIPVFVYSFIYLYRTEGSQTCVYSCVYVYNIQVPTSEFEVVFYSSCIHTIRYEMLF